MTRQKFSVPSVQSINMANLCYMKLHKRMCLMFSPDGDVTLHLVIDDNLAFSSSDDKIDVFFDITLSAAKEFKDYEMPFDSMLSLFAALCLKYGSIQTPF